MADPTPLELWVAWQAAERDAREWAERRFCNPYDPNVRSVADQTEARAALAEARLAAATECAIYDRECDPDDPDNRAIADAVSARLAEIAKEGAR